MHHSAQHEMKTASTEDVRWRHCQATQQRMARESKCGTSLWVLMRGNAGLELGLFTQQVADFSGTFSAGAGKILGIEEKPASFLGLRVKGLGLELGPPASALPCLPFALHRLLLPMRSEPSKLWVSSDASALVASTSVELVSLGTSADCVSAVSLASAQSAVDSSLPVLPSMSMSAHLACRSLLPPFSGGRGRAPNTSAVQPEADGDRALGLETSLSGVGWASMSGAFVKNRHVRLWCWRPKVASGIC